MLLSVKKWFCGLPFFGNAKILPKLILHLGVNADALQ